MVFSKSDQRGTAPLPYDTAHNVKDQSHEIVVKTFLHLLLCQEPLRFLGSAEAQSCTSTSKQEGKRAKLTAHLFPFLQCELHRSNPDHKSWLVQQSDDSHTGEPNIIRERNKAAQKASQQSTKFHFNCKAPCLAEVVAHHHYVAVALPLEACRYNANRFHIPGSSPALSITW